MTLQPWLTMLTIKTTFSKSNLGTCVPIVCTVSRRKNYNRFADQNILGAALLIYSDLRIYRTSFFLLELGLHTCLLYIGLLRLEATTKCWSSAFSVSAPGLWSNRIWIAPVVITSDFPGDAQDTFIQHDNAMAMGILYFTVNHAGFDPNYVSFVHFYIWDLKMTLFVFELSGFKRWFLIYIVKTSPILIVPIITTSKHDTFTRWWFNVGRRLSLLFSIVRFQNWILYLYWEK